MRRIAFSCCWLTLSSLLPGIALGATPSLEKAQTETTRADSAPEVTNKTTNGKEADKGADLVVTARQTHSEQSVSHVEIQRLLPGLNPVKAIAILPGVVFTNADPWGNNEQNSSLFIHGFSKNQLGYTMDGVPLGDQDYGNYNGLSPQRAMISENTKSASLSSGAGALGTASTSNLGGTLEFLTSDPLSRAGGQISQTFGSYSTYRTFARIDTGEFGDGNKAYVSWARQDAKAWDFNGHQGGNQVNAKFIHQDDSNKLTLYFDWSKKIEPNEDGVVMPSSIYVRPSMYPDFNYAQNYLSASGATPAAAGLNYRNYYSDAQREDFLGYIKFTHDFSNNVSWDNQFYYHHNAGVGVVAGPIQAAGLPALFEAYFPGQNLKSVFGNSGYATRTTEYLDNRGGLMSSLHYKTGKHSIEVGGWYERNDNTQARNWYALDVNSPSTPYQRPKNPLIRQYKNAFYTNTFVTHLQDTWRITHNLTLQAGFKSELVYTDGKLPIAALPGSLSPKNAITVPGGKISATKPFLPAFGALWNVTPHEQLFANIQENMRSFEAAGYGNATPWGVTSQEAFEDFKKHGKPETSWTYETGIRTNREVHFGPLTHFSGQLEYYHVHFSNRLLAVSTTQTNSSIVGSATILTNVGSVTTDGMDLSFTMKFGPHFSVYNALSYNRSVYNDNYNNGSSEVMTAGKRVAGVPDWTEKFVGSFEWGNFSAQITGDIIGKRPATFTNDLSAGSYMIYGLNAGYTFHNIPHVRDLRIQGNITNLTNEKGWSTLGTNQASGQYTAFPIAPRMFFITVQAGF